MQLLGFIIRIYHDARSPERQIKCVSVRACKSMCVCVLPNHPSHFDLVVCSFSGRNHFESLWHPRVFSDVFRDFTQLRHKCQVNASSF